MRASAVLIIITTVIILVSASAHATHKSWIVCPKEVVALLLGSVPDGDSPRSDETRRLIREAWCYDLTMPHERIVPDSPDLPEWVIPHDAIDWIAFEIENMPSK